MEFEKTTAAFLEKISQYPNSHTVPEEVNNLRDDVRKIHLDNSCKIAYGVGCEDFTIESPYGPIPVRRYTASNPLGDNHKSDTRSLLLYFHGGAWVLSGLDEYDGLCSQLAMQGGVDVLSVDYRLAPEHKFPAAFEDCYHVLHAVVAGEVPFEANYRRIGIAGDSAGGNLAAAVSHKVRKEPNVKIDLQMLFYPCLAPHDPVRFPSHEAYGSDENYLNRRDFDQMLNLYAPTEDVHESPILWPILDKDLSGLPETYLVSAEFDMLRDEASVYASMLAEAGVTVTEREYRGTIHGFMAFAGTIQPGFQALSDAADYLARWKA